MRDSASENFKAICGNEFARRTVIRASADSSKLLCCYTADHQDEGMKDDTAGRCAGPCLGRDRCQGSAFSN